MPTPKIVPRAMLLEPPEPLRCAMEDDELQELVDSIKRLGILEPLLVMPRYQNCQGEFQAERDPGMGELNAKPSKYEIVDGHRRYIASGRAGLEEIPVMIFEDSEDAKHAIMLDATQCHVKATPFEEGVQFLELAEKHRWSMTDLMHRFHRSEDYINDRVDAVRKDARVAAALRDRAITLGQAKEILKQKSEPERLYLLEQAAVHGATIRSLTVMRQHQDADARIAQGILAPHTPPAAVPPVAVEKPVCVWCHKGDDPENLRTIQVHWYHREVTISVVDKVAEHNLTAPPAGGGSS